MQTSLGIDADSICKQRALMSGLGASSSQDAGYTLIFERGANSGPSPLRLLDAVRPGLGTLLAKAAESTQQSTNSTPRWVVQGQVQPLGGGPQDFYCWEVNGRLNCPAVSQ